MVSPYIAHITCYVRFTHVTLDNCTCSIMYHFNPLLKHTACAAISALGTNHTHCHLCHTRYLFTPESSEACEGEVPCSMTQHQNNLLILRWEKHDISLKILHQTAGSDIGKAPRCKHCATKPFGLHGLYTNNSAL